jgi:hypothetical protein
MSKTYAVRTGSRQSIQNTRDAVANRESFATSGALRGSGDSEHYLVMSYAAVIARYTAAHGWIVPERKYSVTTSNHQRVVRAALSAAGVEFAHPYEF